MRVSVSFCGHSLHVRCRVPWCSVCRFGSAGLVCSRESDRWFVELWATVHVARFDPTANTRVTPICDWTLTYYIYTTFTFACACPYCYSLPYATLHAMTHVTPHPPPKLNASAPRMQPSRQPAQGRPRRVTSQLTHGPGISPVFHTRARRTDRPLVVDGGPRSPQRGCEHSHGIYSDSPRSLKSSTL
jgi:hypothetical protein